MWTYWGIYLVLQLAAIDLIVHYKKWCNQEQYILTATFLLWVLQVNCFIISQIAIFINQEYFLWHEYLFAGWFIKDLSWIISINWKMIPLKKHHLNQWFCYECYKGPSSKDTSIFMFNLHTMHLYWWHKWAQTLCRHSQFGSKSAIFLSHVSLKFDGWP